MLGDAGGSEHLGLVREAPRSLGRLESGGRARALSPKWAGFGRAGFGRAGPRRAGQCSGKRVSEDRARCREEKEFGFRGAEGRLLLLQNCGVRVQVAEGGAVSGEAGLGGLLGPTS